MKHIHPRAIATLVVVLILCQVMAANASSFYQPPQPALNNGVAWLLTHQNADSSWGNVNGSAVRDTALALEALRRTGNTGSNYRAGLLYLASQPLNNNDSLAQRAIALAQAGVAVTNTIDSLIASQAAPAVYINQSNWPEGGWGLAPSYASDVLDTLLVLDTFYAAGQISNTTVTQPGLFYLLMAQSSAGGWGITADAQPSNPFLTANTLLTLNNYFLYFDFSYGHISNGANWLVSQQNPDGGWGNPASTLYESLQQPHQWLGAVAG